MDIPADDLELPVRLLTLALVAVLDPIAVAPPARCRHTNDACRLTLTMCGMALVQDNADRFAETLRRSWRVA
jgi:hypothetical protein